MPSAWPTSIELHPGSTVCPVGWERVEHRVGRITCLDGGTGQPVYEQERLAAPGPYYASPVAADGRLYLCSLAGVVTVLTAGDSPSVLASNPLGETTAASPAVIDSTLYVRTARHLYAFGETKRP
jgi:outer membrane protein assembly factor BamB